ncbi:MAG: hypothetical protein AB1641_15020 [Thermodesulfobacteriota bacterium]
MLSRKSYLILILLSSMILAAGVVPAADFTPQNSPDNLKALFKKLHAAMTAQDDKTAAALAKPLFPDEARLRKALRDNVSAEAVKAILNQQADFLKSTPAARIFAAKPENTEVLVFKATTEEIAQYKEGTMAFQEFPGGTRRLAETVLRPGLTFYEVSLVKPGERSGMKFHLFYWDGQGWAMVGPAWRVIK